MLLFITGGSTDSQPKPDDQASEKPENRTARPAHTRPDRPTRLIPPTDAAAGPEAVDSG